MVLKNIATWFLLLNVLLITGCGGGEAPSGEGRDSTKESLGRVYLAMERIGSLEDTVSLEDTASYFEAPGMYGSIHVEEAKPNIISPDSLFEAIEFIPLETKEDFLIGRVENVFASKDRIVVRDGSPNIFIFDRKGKAISRISNFNKGPEDYLSLSGIAFDPDSGLIHVLCSNLLTIKVYNLDGQYVRSERTKNDNKFQGDRLYLYQKFYVVDKMHFVSGEDHYLRVKLYDRTKNESAGGCIVPPPVFREGSQIFANWIDMSQGKLYALSLYDNGIFEIAPSSVKKVYDFDIASKQKLTQKIMQVPRKKRGDILKGKLSYMDYFYITKDFIHLYTDANILYSRTSHKVKNIFIVEFTPTAPMILVPKGKYGDYLIQEVPAMQYNIIAGKNLDPEANPVLMFYKFKKF